MNAAFICIERNVLTHTASDQEAWDVPQASTPLISLTGDTAEEVRRKLNSYLASPEAVACLQGWSLLEVVLRNPSFQRKLYSENHPPFRSSSCLHGHEYGRNEELVNNCPRAAFVVALHALQKRFFFFPNYEN